jgi:hypothetical protein
MLVDGSSRTLAGGLLLGLGLGILWTLT